MKASQILVFFVNFVFHPNAMIKPLKKMLHNKEFYPCMVLYGIYGVENEAIKPVWAHAPVQRFYITKRGDS